MADIPGNSTTKETIDAGQEYFGKIEKPKDSDWIAINLVAGQSYSFNLVAAAANGDASYDPTLSLYGSDSKLIVSNDDVGKGLIVSPLIGGDDFASGSYLHFTATTSGTYYLAASGSHKSTGNYMLSAYADDIPNSLTTPATLQIGGSVTGQANPAANGASFDDDYYSVKTVVGHYYTVTVSGSGDNPLHSTYVNARTTDGTIIRESGDWGFGVSQITFKALESTTLLTTGEGIAGSSGQYTLQINEASPLDTLAWNLTSPKNIKVFFVGDGDVTAAAGEHFTAQGWTQPEIDAAMRAYGKWSDVADIHFTQVTDPSAANFFMFKGPHSAFDGELAHWDVDGGTATVGGTNYTIDGAGVFDASTEEWGNQQDGGDGFLTLVHEIGHGMGLAHPFDNGGGSAALPGVIAAFGEYGDYNLNQSVYSIMAYNRGYAEAYGAVGTPINYGGADGPMALDIAAIQRMYGANTDHNGGNDTYILPTANDVGTYFQAIWDTGGKDSIVQKGSDAAVIDLRPASIHYDSIAGGGISFVSGIRGGFTIARGVVIENATGGTNDDHIVGSNMANTLHGNDGIDFLAGLGGNDRIFGDAGADRLYGDGIPAIPSGVGLGDGSVTKAMSAGNIDFATAIDVTNEFALTANADIENSTTNPHVTISGTGDGNRDYYKLTLAAGVTITADIDGMSGGGDSNVRIYGADTINYLAQFDDGGITDGAGGSTTASDSFGRFTTVSAGTYYLRVSDFNTGTIGSGITYTLNVSVASKVGAIASGAGKDSLDGGQGDDTMTGGGGKDTFVFATGYGTDTITDFASSGKNHDVIDLSGLKGVGNFNDAKALFEKHGQDVWIDTGHSDVLVIQHVTIGHLGKDDFSF